jgi:uncharacterized protein
MKFLNFPNPALAEYLYPHIFDTQDSAHDEAHIVRVWKNAFKISEKEGGDLDVLQASTFLHDCIWVSKNSPLRSQASRMAAEKSHSLLRDYGWSTEMCDKVYHAIQAHSFSANVTPLTLEAKILQDADRLDAIGYIGIARCFSLGGMLERTLYNVDDPAAKFRDLDDRSNTLDHFQTKLLHLTGGFQTKTGQEMAVSRTQVLQDYFDGLIEEVSE